MPNAREKIPNPVALDDFGVMSVTAALSIDSCAPMPIPHITTPAIRVKDEFPRKTRKLNGAETMAETTSTFIPRRS